MSRNLTLLITTVAVLGVLFAGYCLLVSDPTVHSRGEVDGAALPKQAAGADAPPLRVANQIDIPPGKGVEFTIYDSHTGKPAQHFRCDEWTPLDTKNQIRVTRPELSMRLPGGMTATISAAEGEITVDRIEKAAARPRQGAFRGGVRIAVTRAAHTESAPADQAQEDFATITLDEVEFDLDRGELHTGGALQIAGPDFELSGTGLDLVWNQADNVIESLVLHQGDQLVLAGGAGMFRSAEPGAADSGTPPAKSRQAASAPAKKKNATRRSNAYACVMTGGVSAEEFNGQEQIGEMTADNVRILFDVGGAADRFVDRATSTAPASRPTSRPQGERLVVRWNGPLRLEPQPTGVAGAARRHFEAQGEPLMLSHADGVVRCGRLEYYDETQQLWLHPMPEARVEFGLGAGLSATAASIYADQAHNLVKLIGPVDMVSQRGSQKGAPPQKIHCEEWAELHLSPARPTSNPSDTPRRPGQELARYGQLTAATFVGDAMVDLGGKTLAAQRIDATFKPTGDDQSLASALESAIATNHVKLAQPNEGLECERLELAFGLTPAGELYPTRMDALGSVLIAREKSWIGGDHVVAELEPAPAGGEPNGPAFVLRTLKVEGDAELRDPRNKVSARGQLISATFAGLNRLEAGTVRGTADEHAMVHAAPYTVRGEQIDLAWATQRLHVDGPSKLSFKTQRGLEGQRRDRPTPVTVTATESLDIDGSLNTVHFAGQVVAASGEEQLKGDTLTLLLEDVEKPVTTQPQTPSLSNLLDQARQILGQKHAGKSSGEFLDLQADEPGRGRKEPVRLVADNALVQSETYESGDPQPIVHSSITAPLLEVDIVHREITTHGRTTLLVTSRRMEAGGATTEPDTFGLPSALITRGPSQTAMQCDGSMTYVLGTEGPSRRDSVLFQDGVLLVHRAGRDMVNIEEMLPQVRTHPELVANLKSRNSTLQCDRLECEFVVDSGGHGNEPAPAGSRAGMQLAWMLASGHAELTDVQGNVTRSVNAAQLNFDRAAGLIRVLGSAESLARIYEGNPDLQDAKVVVGEAFTIDLNAGTVRSGATKGEFREQ